MFGSRRPAAVGRWAFLWILSNNMVAGVPQNIQTSPAGGLVRSRPVAIRLSEPDVMVNFLYAREWDKIRVVASSELFTEWNIISDRTSHGTIVNCGCKICKNNIDCWCVYRTRRNFECSQSTARAGTACFELASCAAADDRVLEGSWSWRLYLVATQMEANQRADAATRIGCIATNETVTLPERTTFGDTRNCGSIVF